MPPCDRKLFSWSLDAKTNQLHFSCDESRKQPLLDVLESLRRSRRLSGSEDSAVSAVLLELAPVFPHYKRENCSEGFSQRIQCLHSTPDWPLAGLKLNHIALWMSPLTAIRLRSQWIRSANKNSAFPIQSRSFSFCLAPQVALGLILGHHSLRLAMATSHVSRDLTPTNTADYAAHQKSAYNRAGSWYGALFGVNTLFASRLN